MKDLQRIFACLAVEAGATSNRSYLALVANGKTQFSSKVTLAMSSQSAWRHDRVMGHVFRTCFLLRPTIGKGTFHGLLSVLVTNDCPSKFTCLSYSESKHITHTHSLQRFIYRFIIVVMNSYMMICSMSRYQMSESYSYSFRFISYHIIILYCTVL